MLAFRTEIRNSPLEQTIKVFLVDIKHNDRVKRLFENLDDVKLVEKRQSVERNRVSEHITIFRKEGVDINKLRDKLKACLKNYFYTK